ncbi:MAG: GGDEF domain-containing protein [Tenericutes bacterium]|jgi:c-di-GMP phosphodiesterase|nr:GGDEF domain-containing protein [Mycoplasmatota bacterium]
MKSYNYMDIIPKAKKIIRYVALIYTFVIVLITIVIRKYPIYSTLSPFAQLAYIVIPILLIIFVVLFFTHEILGAIFSLLFISTYNVATLFIDNVRNLELQMNMFFAFGLMIIFLRYFEKAIQSERIDYQILMGRYEQLNLYSNITKSMSEITTKMLINDDLNLILQTILEKAVHLIPKAQYGSILIRNEDRMEFRAAVGYDLKTLKKINLYFEDMFQYKLDLLYEPTIISDVKTFNKKNLKAETTKSMEDSDALTAKSVLTCSFVLNDTIYGFINLDNLEDYDAFGEQDKSYIKHFASQIEIALNNHLMVEKIYNLSKYDELTGVFSRKYHEKTLHDIYDDSKKANKEFSVAVMDINNLKQINDTYGHNAGDEYLKHFTTIIKDNIRDNDVLSRTGGDEFVLTMSNASLEKGQIILQRIKEAALKRPFVYEKIKHTIEFGCGVASYPEDDKEIIGLMRIADQRMYEDKKKSKASK